MYIHLNRFELKVGLNDVMMLYINVKLQNVLDFGITALFCYEAKITMQFQIASKYISIIT